MIQPKCTAGLAFPTRLPRRGCPRSAGAFGGHETRSERPGLAARDCGSPCATTDQLIRDVKAGARPGGIGVYRVLRPAGRIAFNFDTMMTDPGIEHFRRFQLSPGVRNVFRYHHPESMARILLFIVRLGVAFNDLDEGGRSPVEPQLKDVRPRVVAG